MDDEVVVALILGLVLAAGALVVMAIGAWVRVGRLERRLAALEARTTAAAASAVTTPVVAVAHVVAPPTAPAHALDPLPPAPADIPPLVVAAPAMPAAPRTSADWEQVIAGRWLNRIGLVAVAIGMSYFLKYAIDNDWIGPTGQVAIGVLTGAALIGSGPWWVRRGYVYFADGLAGLGAVILYLSAWAGTNYYHLISPAAGFAFMVAITAGILAIAVGRGSQRIAVFGLLGGFLTPALVSTGQNAEVALFSYLALLNASLLPLAWTRRWRFLEVPAFAFSVLYYAAWYDRYFEASAIGVTAIFALLFFAEFLALPVLRARRGGALVIEQTLLAILNPAVWLLVLRGILWPDHRWALTAVTLVLAAIHLFVARIAAPSNDTGRAPARLLFAGVALALATVAIPMRLDGPWVTSIWAIEAAVLVWVGLRVDIVHMRTMGLLLLGGVTLTWLSDPPQTATFFLNPRLGTAAVIVGSLIAVLRASRVFAPAVRGNERPWYAVVGVLGNILGLVALTFEVHTYFNANDEGFAWSSTHLAEGLVISLLWTLCATALTVTGVRTERPSLRWQGLALFGLVVLKVFFYDLADLRGFYRIVSAIALGVLLLVVSFLYQRRAKAAIEAPKT